MYGSCVFSGWGSLDCMKFWLPHIARTPFCKAGTFDRARACASSTKIMSTTVGVKLWMSSCGQEHVNCRKEEHTEHKDRKQQDWLPFVWNPVHHRPSKVQKIELKHFFLEWVFAIEQNSFWRFWSEVLPSCSCFVSFKCNLVLALFMSRIHFVLAVCISKKDGAHAALSQTHSPKELSCLLTIHLCTIFLVSRMKKHICQKKLVHFWCKLHHL